MIRIIAFFLLNLFFLSPAAAIEAAGSGNLRGLTTTTAGLTDCSTVRCAENPCVEQPDLCGAGMVCLVLPAIASNGQCCPRPQCRPEIIHCGDKACGNGEYCCNESCGICAPLGGMCTAEVCNDFEVLPISDP